MSKALSNLLSLLIFCCILLPSANAQFVNYEKTWQEFLKNSNTSNISELPKPGKEQVIDYAKYCLMYATTHFCSSEMVESEEMMAAIKDLGESSYSGITGYKERYEDLAAKIDAYQQVEYLWTGFVRNKSVSMGDLEKAVLAKKVCEKGTLAKYFYMMAHIQYCEGNVKEAKANFENRVLKLAERTSLKIEDISGMTSRVKKFKTLFQNIGKLNVAWKNYLESDESEGFNLELPEISCYAVPSMKKYVLQAAVDVCEEGPAMLKKIKKLQKKNEHTLEGPLAKKIEWLESVVGRSTGDVAVLNKAWEDFLDSGELSAAPDFGFDYCRIQDVLKAYTIVGWVQFCEKGEETLQTIAELLNEHEPELDSVVQKKIEGLLGRYEQSEKERSALDDIWVDFIINEDTLTEAFEPKAVYCDQMTQVRSWTIQGHLDACGDGQKYLDLIDAFAEKHELSFDSELDCRVLRLRGKVYQCRYWELVLQARKETHEERESFGPASSQIMQDELNSKQLPCPTTVAYTPLGNIGVQYIITAFLCQNIDLAKMGDPAYYKKIATWVDTEVLQKYCEASMRCKEDFYIYLEGHTDGHLFRGAKYKKSLAIPEGTIFTHFLDSTSVDTLVTTEEITTSLSSNMELGLARAWTVKKQLDFMEVPITIGAYEHSEKGGDYRRIEIELNITNLLLDFYEKRLEELIEEAGIGERPETC